MLSCPIQLICIRSAFCSSKFILEKIFNEFKYLVLPKKILFSNLEQKYLIVPEKFDLVFLYRILKFFF